MDMTNAQQAALLQVVSAVYDAITSAGPDGAPAGLIYAALMEQGCTMEQYQEIEGLMIRTGLVSKKFDRLIANRPKGS